MFLSINTRTKRIAIGAMAGILLIGIPFGYVYYRTWRAQNTPSFAPSIGSYGNQNYIPASGSGLPGSREDRILVHAKHQEHGYDSLLTFSSEEEPTVRFSSYSLSGTMRIAMYQAHKDLLLEFLAYDKEKQQHAFSPATSTLPLLATTTKEIQGWDSPLARLTLPFENTGIMYVHAEIASTTKDFFAVRSPYGVLLKEGKDNFLFWGQSFKTHRSITGGTISLYNLEERPNLINTVLFNNEGIASAKLERRADIALAYVNDALAVIPINLTYQNNYAYREFAPQEPTSRYFLFTDRPLYRPGDTLYFKAILRQDNDESYFIPRGKISVAVYQGWDNRNPMYAKNHDISPRGTVEGEIVLPQDSGPGSYRIVVRQEEMDAAEPSPWRYNSGETTVNFQVAYFRKPEYSIEARAERTEVVSGDTATFTIHGAYFFGQPLGGQEVSYTIYRSNLPEWYTSYYVYDQQQARSDEYRYGYWQQFRVKEGKIKLDDEGNATIPLALDTPKDSASSQVYSLEATYDDGSGNPTFSRKNILAYRGEFSIYRSRQENFSTSVGSIYRLPLIVVPNRKGVNIKDIPLSITVTRSAWVRDAVQEGTGYSYHEERETLPPLRAMTDASGRAEISIPLEKNGSYDIKVSGNDQKKNTVTQTYYAYAYDGNNWYGATEGDTILSLRVNKQEFKPGERATLMIGAKTPNYDVLISTERAFVHQWKVLKMEGEFSTWEIPLSDADVPNLFVKASTFSPRGYETVQDMMKISAEGKKLAVTITTDRASYGPGDTVTARIHTRDAQGVPVSADTAVWAVDKALFELTDERPADIVNYFWNERYYSTTEAHSLEGLYIPGAEMGGCFAKETPILMAEGLSKPISEIKKGDVILTKRDDKGNTLVQGTVQQVFAHTVHGVLIINGTLRVTPEHLIMVNGAWREAGAIQIGDALTDRESMSVPVTSIEWQQGKQTVYNLSVDPWHTFIADGVWVHNDKGGGGARSVFKDTAYWNPHVETDAQGNATVRFEIPDNLTTWVLSAVGASQDTKVGQQRTEIMVTKEVIIRPILPNVLMQGDDLTLTAMVQNYTDAPLTFAPTLSFSAGSAVPSKTQALSVPSSGIKEFSWRIIPQRPDQKASLAFAAHVAGESAPRDTVVQNIPVRTRAFIDKHAESARGDHAFSIEIPPDARNDQTTATLTFATSLLGTLPQAIAYLVDYPYGCVEQTTSRFVPAVIARAEPVLFAEAIKGKNVDAMIEKGITRLSMLQNPDGGWGWWGGSSDPFISAYVFEYLTLAQNNGFILGEHMHAKVKNFLEQGMGGTEEEIARFQTDRPGDFILRSFSLSLAGEGRGKIPLTVFASTTPDYLALGVLANIQAGISDPTQNGLALLIEKGIAKGGERYWDAGSVGHFGSREASTALALRALIAGKADPRIASEAATYIANARKKDYWRNSFTTAHVIRAIAEYWSYVHENVPQFTYTVVLEGEKIASGTIDNKDATIPEIAIPYHRLPQNRAAKITVNQEGSGSLYTTLVVKKYRTDISAAKLDNGIIITREYENLSRYKKPIAVGDIVKVKLRLQGIPQEEYAVITDELPSGLIPINESLKNEQYNTGNETWWWNPKEYTENGVHFIIPYWWYGRGENFEYRARAIIPGEFLAPPASAEIMYAPDTKGRTDFQKVNIAPRPQ